jgi:hypothetical protein
MSILLILTHKNQLTNLPLGFLFIYKLTKHYKFNNMRLVILIWFSDFMQVLYNIRKHPTKNECFRMHILFTTIYLLHKQKLSHGYYSEQELNMGNFVLSNGYDVHMYAKF